MSGVGENTPTPLHLRISKLFINIILPGDYLAQKTPGNVRKRGTPGKIRERRFEGLIAPPTEKETEVLKKTAAAGGLLITAAAGALVTCAPAFAEPALVGHSQTHLVSNKNRNWNGSENENLNRIRLRIHNRNNNVAVARTRGNRRDNDANLLGNTTTGG